MRTRVFGLFGLFLLLLAGCTGTSEPEIPVLVAAADASGVRFLLARDLNQGRLTEVGDWSVAGVADLLAAGGKLYLLAGGKLARYDLGGFSEAAVPDPATAREESWPIPSCDAGYLRAGAADLLIVCGPNAVYRLKDAATAAGPPQPEPGTAALGFDALAFALYPDNGAGKDRLAFAYARPGGGWHLEVAGDAPGTPLFQKDLDAPTPSRIVLRRAPEAGGLGVLASADGSSALYAFRGDLDRLAEAGRSFAGLTGDQGLWAAYGTGYLVVQGKEKAEAGYPSYRAGWFHPDFYLYLASDTGLDVLDVATLPIAYQRHVALAGVRALTGFPLR